MLSTLGILRSCNAQPALPHSATRTIHSLHECCSVTFFPCLPYPSACLQLNCLMPMFSTMEMLLVLEASACVSVKECRLRMSRALRGARTDISVWLRESRQVLEDEGISFACA